VSNEKIKRMERYFERFLRRTWQSEIFPREVWLSKKNWGARYVINDMSHFVSMLRNYSGRVNIYTALHSIPQNLRNEIDCLFFETDFNDVSETNIADSLIIKALKRRGIRFRRFWTNGRSVHYYIPIDPTQLQNRKWTIERWMRFIPQLYDVKTRYCVEAQMVRVVLTTQME